jgi:hypothetical protein
VTDEWASEDQYWQKNYKTRPYADAVGYAQLRGGYRYGVESTHRHKGKQWSEVEDELALGWDSYEHSGDAPWEQVRDAVYDAWARVMRL